MPVYCVVGAVVVYHTGHLFSALILSTPAEVHFEAQVMGRNEQSQSVLCMRGAKWERDSSESWCWLDTRCSLWYAGLDGAGELPFPAKTCVVRSDLEIFSAAR